MARSAAASMMSAVSVLPSRSCSAARARTMMGATDPRASFATHTLRSRSMSTLAAMLVVAMCSARLRPCLMNSDAEG